ncbi:hypothetical protein AB0X74_13435 [Kurthia gibsonii]|uniref:hypothetical protein n=1 Tax=Kurthia TaxID=1649 RepID=UPI00254F7BE4|nr:MULTISPECIES: hypothetical protein [Kurthia]MEB6111951.1 hypothetical protein [Kurthia gibsonii]WIL39175.1 hypothetical protein QN089_02650 [Kurthia sp. YJT4]
MNKKIAVFLIIELFLIACLVLSIFTEMHFLILLIFILSPATLIIMLLVSDHKRGNKGSRITFFVIVFSFYLQMNLLAIIDDSYTWRGLFRLPEYEELDEVLFPLIILVGVSLLVAFIAIYELIAMYERNNKKRSVNEMDEK